MTLAFGVPASFTAPKDQTTTHDAVQFISGTSTATAGDTGAIFHDPIFTTQLVSDPDQVPRPPLMLPIFTTKKV